MIKPGKEWGRPATGPPDLEVAGDDVALALALAAFEGRDPLVRFRPGSTSDLARAVGLDAAGAPASLELPVDVLRLGADRLVCNMVVLGTPPERLHRWSRAVPMSVSVDGRAAFDGRATTVVVATGQFRRGFDLVPRGHPGDGRAEIQVYALTRPERAALRARVANGRHLPNPRIAQRSGRRIEVRAGRPLRLEVDRGAAGTAAALDVEVLPAAYRLLV